MIDGAYAFLRSLEVIHQITNSFRTTDDDFNTTEKTKKTLEEERILVTHNSNHITTRALIDIILVPLQCTICAFVKWNTCPRGAKYFFLAGLCFFSSFLLFSRKRHFFDREKRNTMMDGKKKKQLSGAQKRKKKKEKEEAMKEALADMERLKLGPSKLWTGMVLHHKDVFVTYHVLPG